MNQQLKLPDISPDRKESNQLSDLLEEINVIMWESHMVKGREFGKPEGDKIMGVLEKWANID